MRFIKTADRGRLNGPEYFGEYQKIRCFILFSIAVRSRCYVYDRGKMNVASGEY